ncbi:MAG TPA: bifunctional phosphopantothenoylcysteine decarboxylase/phosphopantothenate--cysteine ligase CoaBC [Gammaproteobacteria bacterium]
MNDLADKRILLGISGGIAAYKSAELVRLLRRAGAEVRVVMTEAAGQFITPMTLQALSGHPVRQALFDPAHEAAMGHIELARWADQVIVAPASADFIARLAAGMADDLLTTLCLATTAPLLLAPAMNHRMWLAPVTQENVLRLQGRGVQMVGPASGEQACGESGPGRMVEPAEIVAVLVSASHSGPLAGVRVTVTAGPTREPLDPVRFISNRSSGKMGFAVAAAAAAAGARVRLVSGPVSLPAPPGVERVDVESAAQMLAAVLADPGEIFIAAAAVADYRPARLAAEKIKKSKDSLTLELSRNEDIVATVAALPGRPFTIGFAAETERLAEHARDKLARKRLDLVAANWVGAQAEGGGFDSDENALELFWPGGHRSLARGAKERLAVQLIDEIARLYGERQPHN